MTFNPALHNRQSIRLHGYDYSQSGAYFITICAYKKQNIFGTIVDAEMKLNLAGQYAFAQWMMIPKRFNIVELGEVIIMPNHIHGIIVIQSGRGDTQRGTSGLDNGDPGAREWLISNPSPLQENDNTQPNGTIRGSIGAIIQNFKSSVSRKINAMPKMKGIKIWQKNYYDHIIRDEEDYARIVEYIRNNPQSWEKDELFDLGL